MLECFSSLDRFLWSDGKPLSRERIMVDMASGCQSLGHFSLSLSGLAQDFSAVPADLIQK